MHNSSEFRIGNYRPIYLWAGPGTIRMNKVKFMQVDVDEKVHLDAHEAKTAGMVVNNLYQNWFHLTYSWGFPPEIEREDWESFESATKEYHALNAKVFAYIQSSNCVHSGSFISKDWYALTPQGKKVYYYSGRYMTCFQKQTWIDYLKERISDAINRGADGIFFDNLWYGLQPNSLFQTWLGGAGCYCDTCKKTYQAEKGVPIPVLTDLKQQEVVDYIAWRADRMTEVIQELSNYARSIKPNVVISANDYDPVMRPVKLIFGIDFEKLAMIQDVTMIENFALPKYQNHPEKLLVNNAITVRNTHPFLLPEKHLSVLSYDAGIGFDPVYPVNRILTGMAEAAALGCSMTTKGTEYHDGTKMTLLTAPEYQNHQTAIGQLHRWLEENQSIFKKQTERCAEVVILHPGEKLWQHWHKLAPIFFAVQQTLLVNGIPWKVIPSIKTVKPGNQLITFTENDPADLRTDNVSIINALDFSFSKSIKDSFFEKNPVFQPILSTITDQLIRGYHASRAMRWMMDKLGMSKLVTHTPFFKIHYELLEEELLEKLNTQNFFRVISEFPVLIDVWKPEMDQYHIHLVNYYPEKQSIRLHAPNPLPMQLLSPTAEPQILGVSHEVEMTIDLYNILTPTIKE